METRLKDVRKIVTEELPAAARKPTYVMEYGVRGIRNFEGKPTVESGYWRTAPTWRGRTSPRSSSCGSTSRRPSSGSPARSSGTRTGASTTAPTTRSTAMIGPASEGWPLFPTYYALGLLLQTTQRGWQVLQVAPWDDDDWEVGVARPAGEGARGVRGRRRRADGEGLDSHGRDLNTVSAEAPAVQHRRPAAVTSSRLALWNADRRRPELDRRDRDDERRRRRAVRGAAARGLRAHDGARLLRARGARPRPDAPHTRAS